MNPVPHWWPALPEVAAALAGCAPAAVSELLRIGDVCLRGEQARGKTSSLNNDGTPVQIAVGAGGRFVRLLMDPAHQEPDPVRRCEQALQAARRLLEPSSQPELSSAFEAGLREALPGADAMRKWLNRGAVWLAADLAGRRAGAYVSARWGAPAERWDRVLAWLDKRHRPASRSLARVVSVAEPASVGLEAASANGLRLKVYLRLSRPQRLGGLGLPDLDHPALEDFLRCVVRDRSIGLSGLVISLSAALQAGPMSSKIDVCAHCLRYSNSEWVEILAELAGGFARPDPAVVASLTAGQAEMAFIGFSPSPDGSHRLNFYLKAPSRAPAGRR